MEPFFPPPSLPHFLASQPLPTAAPPQPPPLTTQAPPPPPQVVIPPAPLAFLPLPQTNLDQLHITQVQVATAPPKQTPNSHNNHPPYAEMIITAIKALNEKTGSSKKAIAKFIDSAYTNLPQSHSALLSNHLKRLKDNGLIITIKNSYTLPPPVNNTNNFSSAPSAAVVASDGTPLPKRGRGRPPKANTSPSPNTTTIVGGGSSNTTTIIGGASPNTTTIIGGASPNTTTVTGGVQDRSDEVLLPAKTGRGPPPRSIAKPKAIAKPKPKPKSKSIVGGGGSRPRGRPRKLITDASASGSGSDLVPGMVILPTTEKTINGDVPVTTVTSITAPTGRGVGRPRKVNVESSTVAPAVNGAVMKPVSSGKPVGRPRKVGSIGRPRKVVGAVGRPRRSAGRPARIDGGVVKKTAAVSTGRPVGRPRKVGNNIKDRVVTLLEESLGLGMNQSVPDMYIRFTQLYTIITGKDYNPPPAGGATAQGNNQ
ncbi:hypothetical protein MKX01_008876 [Papaver californicum]|nr:hypothetical protein MKX01_008876 [Papaver californicum]